MPLQETIPLAVPPAGLPSSSPGGKRNPTDRKPDACSMHGYSTDSSERRFVPLLLAAVAVVCAWLCSKLMAAAHFSTPWWLDAPSSLAFYGVVNTLFDKHLWRNRLVRKLGLSRVPTSPDTGAGSWSPRSTATSNVTMCCSRFSKAGRKSRFTSPRSHRCREVALPNCRCQTLRVSP